MHKVNITLPDWDEYNQHPKTKMPVCPQCKDDKLAMIEEDRCVCYACSLDLIKQGKNWYLVEVPED